MSVGSEAELPWGRPFPANKSARAERWLLFRTSLRFPSLGNRLLPFRSTCRSLAINLVLMGGTFSDLMAQFDPVNRKRKGDQFELVCKWFLENDPTYQSLLRRVWMWDDWPGRQGIDAGIDLVAEDHDGRLWAIQAKAYNPANSVSKRDVDKFIAESSRKTFAYRLLIGTTDKRHHLATKLMDDLDIPFIGLTRLRQADDYLDWPENTATLRPSKPPKPKKPWDYQKAAINDVVKGFKAADRGQLIMACGTGKTLTAWFIKERLVAERTLVLVPSLSLLKQTMLEWQTADPRKPFPALPVCSDETVGSLGEDAAVSHTSDLGVPVTTDPTKIAEFLRKRSGPRVVFSTYQSSPQIAAAFKLGRVPAFDLIVADEAHRVAGPVSSDFATVLDPKKIKAAQRLFMTATPRYFTGRVMRAAIEVDYEVASMDDETRFGAVFHQLTFSEAIERDLLTRYQVAIIGVDDTTYRDWAERGVLVTLDGKKKTDARSLAGQIGLAKAMKKFDLHRVISFHSRVKAAREFAASTPEVLAWMPARQRPKGQLWSKYASGDMSAGERGVLLQHLKHLEIGERGLLANARCLSEGVDVPALDGVAFIDPRRSEVDIVQAVGRAIRKSESKTVGTIVIPVLINTDEDPEVALDSSAFKPVWDVIKALRAHDADLGEKLDALRREMGRKGAKPRLPSEIYVDMPKSVSSEFARAFDIRLVDATTAPWEFWFGLLEDFVARHGHSQVLQRITTDGYRLGAWVSKQRARHAEGALDPHKVRRLQDLPGWTWEPKVDAWEQGFGHLFRYLESHGDTRVPLSTTVDGFQLGRWVVKQRGRYASGTLHPDRKRRLQDLPGWTWNTLDDSWETGFSQLAEYVNHHGHARVPVSFIVEDYRLGVWVVHQRSRHASGTLEADRERRLEELPGWTWDPFDDKWENGFRRLREYVACNGDARMPASYTTVDDGYPLGSWVTIQRSSHSKGTLDVDRERRLQALPGWTWDAVADRWEEGFRRLRTYVDHHGNARVPQPYVVDGYPLGLWVNTQGGRYAKGTLEADRERRLEELRGWVWSARAEAWEEGFSRLADYARHHGHTTVPRNFMVEDLKLGQWVGNQRARQDILDSERKRRLQDLPGWAWDPHAEKWEEGFRRLLNYVQVHGDARVPRSHTVDGYRLGSWTATQRSSYRKRTLTPDRATRLDSLPGWTWDDPRRST